MEKKYYELIVSLIRNHRKFAGYESILDDIVEDVYNHAKIIIDSVTNEEVVLSYLTKVVDTSIITVPKKLNINTRVRHRSITIEPQVQREVVTAEIPAPNQEREPEPELELQPEPVKEEVLEPVIEDTQELTEETLQDNFEEDFINLEQETVDKTLVDKMINGLGEEEPSEEIELPEELEEISEQTLEEEESVDELLLDESSYTEESVITELEEEPQIESEELTEELEQLDEEPEEETSDILIEEPELLDIETSEPFLEEENVNEPALEEAETIEDSSLTLEENEDELIVQEDSLEEPIEEIEEESSDLFVEEPSAELEIEENSVSFALPNYNCFSFKPEKAEFDEQEITSEIAEIESRHPEKQISKICSLKYSKNLSVSEIASAVEMSEEDVLDVLNEIIDIVKD